MSNSPFTMPGSQFLGKGNQSGTPGKYASPAKEGEEDKTTDSDEKVTTAAGSDIGVVKSKAMIRLETNKPAKGSPGYDAWLVAWQKADTRNKAGS